MIYGSISDVWEFYEVKLVLDPKTSIHPEELFY
jgi:hypothetical protein